MHINLLATEAHYVSHLRPVWDALPNSIKGNFCTTPDQLTDDSLTIVASAGDLRKTQGPAVMFEHGAGFSYGGDPDDLFAANHPSYAGAVNDDRDRVALFCNPNRWVQGRNMQAYPDAEHLLVGCPKLDILSQHQRPKQPTVLNVAFTFHWDCKVAPETKWALPHYRRGLRRLRPDGTWRMLGHGHPRAWSHLRRFWAGETRATPVQQFDDVVRLADVYVADTTSTIYEMAALGRPVVVMNAPWYRKDIRHGLRFWDAIPGPQVEHAHEILDAVAEARQPRWDAVRRDIAAEVYPQAGGTQVAADAIVDTLRSL